MESFLIPFGTIALAEMMDKSQLAILLLAGRYKNHLTLFSGVTVAFFALSILAVLAGSFVTTLIPPSLLQIIAAILFILFGILSFRGDSEKQTLKKAGGSAFLTGFTLLFVAELGDKTQLATAAFATQYNPWLVFLGSFLALTLLALLALKVGGYLSSHINKELLHKTAGVLFILIGIGFLLF